MLQRVAFVTLKISNESAEFYARVNVACLCVGHSAFIFMFVGLEISTFELHSVTCCLQRISF